MHIQTHNKERRKEWWKMKLIKAVAMWRERKKNEYRKKDYYKVDEKYSFAIRTQQEKWMPTKRRYWMYAVESSHCNFQFKAGNILLFHRKWGGDDWATAQNIDFFE